MFHAPNKFRLTKRYCGYNSDIILGLRDLITTDADGNNGVFFISMGKFNINCIASDNYGWEHVSISVSGELRCPTWEEACAIKSLFWDEEDIVIQYHPKKSEYVNNHKYCLHLWRPVGVEIPVPPSLLVGIKNLDAAK